MNELKVVPIQPAARKKTADMLRATADDIENGVIGDPALAVLCVASSNGVFTRRVCDRPSSDFDYIGLLSHAIYMLHDSQPGEVTNE